MNRPPHTHARGDRITKRIVVLAVGAVPASGAPPAAGQTALTTSSWAPPSHLMDKVVFEGFAAEAAPAWIEAAATRGIDGAKVLAEFRAELKKVAAGD